MEVPLRLSFKNLEPSAAVAANIRNNVDGLQKFYSRLISCQVVVEIPHRHHHKGNLYQVHITMRIPGEEFVVKQHHRLAGKNRDLYVAIHEAFDAARRILGESKHIQRGDVKTPTPAYSEGHVVRLFETLEDDEDYGFLETQDGREVYFHRNTVLGKHFDQLEVGTLVRFTEEMGDFGPQATTVSIMEKRRKAA